MFCEICIGIVDAHLPGLLEESGVQTSPQPNTKYKYKYKNFIWNQRTVELVNTYKNTWYTPLNTDSVDKMVDKMVVTMEMAIYFKRI